MKPRITLLLGDRNGIGPELIARLLGDSEIYERAAIEVLGDPAVLAQGLAVAKTSSDRERYHVEEFRPQPEIETRPGEATAAAGAEMLAQLGHAAKRARAGAAHGIVFAPLNKQAMHLGGLDEDDGMRFLARELDFDGAVGELNVLDGLWTSRVTSHVALKQVAGLITRPRILEAIHFADDSLRAAGFAAPRLAVAALNPHAGDGGNFGREEIELIEPAVAEARAGGLRVDGPYPSDTVFVRARAGDFDAVVTMYHDQGQIAMKLMGFARGVTVLGGLPVPVTTCGHGTGYDIVGQGIALSGSIENAFAICCDMAVARRDGWDSHDNN